MSGREAAIVARQWLRYARGDLAAAQRHIGIDEPRHVCWFAQQATEKALEAALIWLGISFPFTHDLDMLRELLPTDWPFKAEHADLAFLTAWAVAARYPGMMPEPGPADARAAVAQARAAVDSLLRDLTTHGFELDQ